MISEQIMNSTFSDHSDIDDCFIEGISNLLTANLNDIAINDFLKKKKRNNY